VGGAPPPPPTTPAPAPSIANTHNNYMIYRHMVTAMVLSPNVKPRSP
jgi:hypothetical protein